MDCQTEGREAGNMSPIGHMTHWVVPWHASQDLFAYSTFLALRSAGPLTCSSHNHPLCLLARSLWKALPDLCSSHRHQDRLLVLVGWPHGK
jgi:hypothetical protein